MVYINSAISKYNDVLNNKNNYSNSMIEHELCQVVSSNLIEALRIDPKNSQAIELLQEFMQSSGAVKRYIESCMEDYGITI